ncbi:hypothetical protein MTR67_047011 [Solanum verrucosum]|uniref:Protein YIP n=1 Tax=Solanum verrucosum TaxID=315347 RepID=A0AAF0ZW30_SOLVR|nr:hypothetical protein MTR67_047011 [Solanum verrucosum]
MAKEFNVPPVVFPSGGNPGPQRRLPTAPFQPPKSSNPGIPFMSFDIGSAAASTSFSTPQFASTTIGGGGSTGFEDEPPLLEELGINTKQIYQKTISIMNPFRVKADLHEDADLSGPFIFLMAFGLFQLLAGKLHFGIILGWVIMASLFLYVVFNMLAGRNGNLDLYRCVSLIGYCMLPIVILSAISLFLPGGLVIKVVTGVFVLWSTRVCTRLVVELASCGDEHRGLIALFQQSRENVKLFDLAANDKFLEATEAFHFWVGAWGSRIQSSADLLFCFELNLLKGVIIDFTFQTLFLPIFFPLFATAYKNSLSLSKSISTKRLEIVCGSSRLCCYGVMSLVFILSLFLFILLPVHQKLSSMSFKLVCCLYATPCSPVIMNFVASSYARLIAGRTVEMLW